MFKNKSDSNISYGIIGLNNFGKELAKSLAAAGKEIMVIDTDEETVKELREYTENAYVVKGYDKKTLNETGIQNCDVAVACINGQIDTSILTVLHLVSFGIPRVIAQASSEDQGAVLEKIGAEVIFPDKDMAVRVARRLVPSQIINYIEVSENIDISKLAVPVWMVGKTVVTANIRREFGLNIIAIETGGEITTSIDVNYTFQNGDMLIVIGDRNGISKFESRR